MTYSLQQPRALVGRGFSMVEAVVSMVLVGVVFVGALEVVAQTTKSRAAMTDRAVATTLAQALMAEILAKPYDDPNEADTAFGASAAELTASGGVGVSRSGFDDVRDYNAWSASPPRERDGTKITDAAGMTETVRVMYVGLGDLDMSLATDAGVLKVTVTVTGRDGRVLAELSALRTRSASQAEAGE